MSVDLFVGIRQLTLFSKWQHNQFGKTWLFEILWYFKF
jgi:hypothetical protein